MEVLMGKSSINGPFSMAMLNYQRVPEETILSWYFNIASPFMVILCLITREYPLISIDQLFK